MPQMQIFELTRVLSLLVSRLFIWMISMNSKLPCLCSKLTMIFSLNCFMVISITPPTSTLTPPDVPISSILLLPKQTVLPMPSNLMVSKSWIQFLPQLKIFLPSKSSRNTWRACYFPNRPTINLGFFVSYCFVCLVLCCVCCCLVWSRQPTLTSPLLVGCPTTYYFSYWCLILWSFHL